MDKTQLRRALQIAAALIVVVLVIGLYKAKTDAAKTEAHVRQLQAEISETESDLRALRAGIAAQESPGRIEAMARERLGLVAGGESAALPEAAMDQNLPPPQSGTRP
jgi:cell division protein FtsL